MRRLRFAVRVGWAVLRGRGVMIDMHVKQGTVMCAAGDVLISCYFDGSPTTGRPSVQLGR